MSNQREPDLFRLPPGCTNAPGEQKFRLIVTYGSGAPASAWGKDLEVSDTATGKITVTFPRTYRKLVDFDAHYLKCQAGAVLFPVILTNSIDTEGSAGSNSGGQIVIETRTEAGTATDPASGDIIEYEFVVSNDSLTDNYAITIT